MKEPTPFALSQFFSALAGTPVNFSLAVNAPNPKEACMYGVYSVLPQNDPLVFRISLKALATLGGALLGLPEDSAIERAQVTLLDEPMRDAMHEVLNIASTAIGTDARVVFNRMFRDVASVPSEAAALVSKPTLRSSYRVTIGGVQGELATIFQ